MASPFSVLGLQHGAALADVKKAYARLLKRTRPDEDPVAFQRLQEAYEACVAQAKQAAARVAQREEARVSVPAGMDEEEPEATADALGDALPEHAPARSRFMPMAPPPPLREQAPPAPRREPEPVAQKPKKKERVQREQALAEAELQALLEQIVKRAEQAHGADNLRQWLDSHEQLVSLEVQQLIAQRLPSFIHKRRPQFEPEALRIIIEYFLGDDHSAMRSDARLREAWEQVRADSEYRRRLDAIKRRHSGFFERLRIQELTGVASPWRRRLLLSIPGSAHQMRALLAELEAIEPEREVSPAVPEAREFWSKLLPPSGVSLRLAGVAAAQFALLVCVVTGIPAWLDSLAFQPWLVMAGWMFGLCMGAWLLLKGINAARFRSGRRRAEKLARGEKPADTASTSAIVLCSLAVVMALVQRYMGSDAATPGFSSLGLSGLALLVLILVGPRFRLEMLFFVGSAVVALFTFSAPVTRGADPWVTTCLVFPLAVLMGVGVDFLHANGERIHRTEARRELNWVATVLAIVLLVGTFWIGPALSDHEDKPVPLANVRADAPKDPVWQPPAVPADSQSLQTAPSEAVKELVGRFGVKPAVAEPIVFKSVESAFVAALMESGKAGQQDPPYRAFRFGEGAMDGEWYFAGGGWSGPDRFAHWPYNADEPDQLLCEASAKECKAFRREMRTRPRIFDDYEGRGGVLSFESPGLAPASIECPALGMEPYKGLDSLSARLLFDSTGMVTYFVYDRPADSDAYDAPMENALRHCLIMPSKRNGKAVGGDARVKIRLR